MILTNLWQHQRDAMEFGLSRKYALFNAGMGSGKTLLTYAMIEDMDWDRVLVVTTKRGLKVWQEEAEKHVSGWSPIVLEGTIAKKARDLASHDRGVFIINYAALSRGLKMRDAIIKFNPNAIFLDEGHKIQGPSTKVSKRAWEMRKKQKGDPYRYILTGTPFYSGLSSIFGQARFLDEDIFRQPHPDHPEEVIEAGRSWRWFQFRYEVTRPLPSNPHVRITVSSKNKDDLMKRLEGVMYVIKTEDVIDLPDEMHIYRKVTLSAKARKHYKELKDEYITFLDQGALSAQNVLVKSLRLQQITGGFAPTDSSDELHSIDTEKLAELEEIADGLRQEPFVIFARFKEEIKAIHRTLQALDFDTAELSGDKDELTEWKRGDAQVLIVQCQAGSDAIDLTRASYAIMYSITYSYGQYEQMLARIRRPGADPNGVVRYYHLIAENTIDEAIYEAVKKKDDASEEVLNHLRR